jgi:membrane-bound lytic murein transglycosylase A
VTRLSVAAALIAALALSACTVVPKGQSRVPAPPPAARPAPSPPTAAKPAPSAPAAGSQAILAGVRPGPELQTLGLTQSGAQAALTAFRISCPTLVRRTDASGLTEGADWQAACDAAPAWPVTVADGMAFATGYYEPEILGSRVRAPGYDVPIYRRPPDLVEADLGLFSDEWKGKRIRGRVEEGKLIPYADRAAIEDGALAGRGLELAWAADPIEFFFLQVQGSGRLRLPDGSIMRIGYDSQNGRDYAGIGSLMRQRGLLQPGQASMQGVMAWLRANPEQGRALMRENKSFVFFREISGAGPIGALGLPVTGRASVAADPAFVPLGAPVWLALDRPEATGLWVAQDTGGAIKGANRFDTFWGAGEDARTIAGGMSARGQAYVLLPKGVLARIGSGGGPAARR